jgi:hypothetical protein
MNPLTENASRYLVSRVGKLAEGEMAISAVLGNVIIKKVRGKHGEAEGVRQL